MSEGPLKAPRTLEELRTMVQATRSTIGKLMVDAIVLAEVYEELLGMSAQNIRVMKDNEQWHGKMLVNIEKEIIAEIKKG